MRTPSTFQVRSELCKEDGILAMLSEQVTFLRDQSRMPKLDLEPVTWQRRDWTFPLHEPPSPPHNSLRGGVFLGSCLPDEEREVLPVQMSCWLLATESWSGAEA